MVLICGNQTPQVAFVCIMSRVLTMFCNSIPYYKLIQVNAFIGISDTFIFIFVYALH